MTELSKTEQELMEKMARELFILPDQAHRGLDIVKRAGYKSPEKEVRSLLGMDENIFTETAKTWAKANGYVQLKQGERISGILPRGEVSVTNLRKSYEETDK